MRLNIITKLLGAFAIVLILTGVVGWVGLMSASGANASTQDIFNREVKGLAQLGEVRTYVLRSRLLVLMHIIATDAAEMTRLEGEISQVDAKLVEDMNALKDVWISEAKLNALSRLRTAWNEYIQVRGSQLAASQAGNPEEAWAAYGVASEKAQAAMDIVEELVQINETQAQQRLNQAQQAFATSRNLVLGTLGGAVLIGLAIAIFLSRSIAGNVGRVARAAQGLATGDLTQRAEVRSGDETGILANAFNSMADNLHQMASQVRQAVGNISSMTAQTLAATSQQASTASQQATAVSETTSTVEEVRQTAEQATDRARLVSEVAQKSAVGAEQGLRAVQDTMEGMESIKEQVGNIAETILALSEQTQQIGEIIATVNDIADQSNLLALNAAIEAARAGEAGKGFAVVAGEVRSLAEQSRQATDQVREILGEIQKAANTAVMVTEEGTKRADAGVGQAQQSGEAIRTITERVEQVAQAARQIAASGSQQLTAMDQISTAMDSVNQAAAQTEVGTRQVEGAAQNLNQLAAQLTGIVEQYKVH